MGSFLMNFFYPPTNSVGLVTVNPVPLVTTPVGLPDDGVTPGW